MESKKAKPKAKKSNEMLMIYMMIQRPAYKIFSRAFCNFVFPEAIPRPMIEEGADALHAKVLNCIESDAEQESRTITGGNRWFTPKRLKWQRRRKMIESR